jgi:glycosyltransferase involved in cell wall biosynthesis
VAVLIPCRDEAVSVAGVVQDFRRALPEAQIYVYDNNSRDETRTLAAGAGAIVRRETLQGKGHVVRRMFSDVDADIYVLVDGDGTYDAVPARQMIELLLTEQLDMVNGTRVSAGMLAFRRGHRLGNAVLSGLISTLFGSRLGDIMSGYKVMSRRFVKSFPALSSGFEIETELTIHALELNMPVGQMNTAYRERAAGSASKLRTGMDGMRILATIVRLVKEEKPLQLFSAAALLLLLLAVGLSIPIFVEFERTGLVPRFPTAILSTGIVLVSVVSMACGLILDSVSRGRKEAKRLVYLSIACLPSPPTEDTAS